MRDTHALRTKGYPLHDCIDLTPARRFGFASTTRATPLRLTSILRTSYLITSVLPCGKVIALLCAFKLFGTDMVGLVSGN